jgi:hypothetical protein
MPTSADCRELAEVTNCLWVWDSNRRGFLVTSKINGNSIFFYVGVYAADYWSSNNAHASSAYGLRIKYDYLVFVTVMDKCSGRQIRPVYE